jgi:flagellin
MADPFVPNVAASYERCETMRIQSNLMAANAQRHLSGANGRTAQSIERLSTGLRIARAGDDAAGLVISQRLRSEIGGLGTATRNVADGVSLLQTIEGTLSTVHELLGRVRDLTVAAASEIGSTESRAAVARELEAIRVELNRIGVDARFAGRPLFGSTPYAIQVGASGTGTDDRILVETPSLISLPLSGVLSLAWSSPVSTLGFASLVAFPDLPPQETVTVTQSSARAQITAPTGPELPLTVTAPANTVTAVVNGTPTTFTIAPGLYDTQPARLTAGSAPALPVEVSPPQDQLRLRVDGGAPVVVTVAAGSYATAEDFAVAVNDAIAASSLSGQVSASVEGGRIRFTTTSVGGSSSVQLQSTSAPAVVTASAPPAVPLTVEAGVNDQFSFVLDGTTRTVTLAAGTYGSGAAVASAVAAAVTAAGIGGAVSATLVGGRIRLTTSSSGDTRSIETLASPATTALGFAVGQSAAGTTGLQWQAGFGHGSSSASGSSAINALRSALQTAVNNAGAGAMVEAVVTGGRLALRTRFEGGDMQLAITGGALVGPLGFELASSQGVDGRILYQGTETVVTDTSVMSVVLPGNPEVTASMLPPTYGVRAGSSTYEYSLSAPQARAFLGTIDDRIQTTSVERAQLGAVQNRLEAASRQLGITGANLREAESRLRDTDVAAELIEATRGRILQAASTALLAQAMRLPAGVLRLVS